MEKGIRELLIDDLYEMLHSEKQIIKALPKMATGAESPKLKEAFQSHLIETKEQIIRLEKVFLLMQIEQKDKICHGMKGLIKECRDVLKAFNKSTIRDVTLISKAQRIEHYEISAYGTLRALATELDLDEIAALLQSTLDEELNADKTLSKIAEGGILGTGINRQANILSENTPAE